MPSSCCNDGPCVEGGTCGGTRPGSCCYAAPSIIGCFYKASLSFSGLTALAMAAVLGLCWQQAYAMLWIAFLDCSTNDPRAEHDVFCDSISTWRIAAATYALSAAGCIVLLAAFCAGLKCTNTRGCGSQKAVCVAACVAALLFLGSLICAAVLAARVGTVAYGSTTQNIGVTALWASLRAVPMLAAVMTAVAAHMHYRAIETRYASVYTPLLDATNFGTSDFGATSGSGGGGGSGGGFKGGHAVATCAPASYRHYTLGADPIACNQPSRAGVGSKTHAGDIAARVV